MRHSFINSRYRRIVVFFLFVVSLAIVSVQGCASLRQNEIQGTWIVTDAVIPGISALSTHDAAKWFGQSYQYNANSAMLDQIACNDATYEHAELSDAQFLQQYKVPLNALDAIEDSVTVVTVHCESGYPGPGQKVFVVDNRFSYIFWDGVFFKLEKTAQPNSG